MKKIVLICMATLLSLLWISPVQAAEPIKFGHLYALSGGVGQVYGIPDLKGAKMAVKEINAAGGVLGRPLELISKDGKLSPEVSVREAKDLVLNQKVSWMQGLVSSSAAMAVSAFAKSQKVIYVITGAQSAAITGEKGHPYVFRVTTNTSVYAATVAAGVAKFWPGLKKVFIMGPDYEYGHRCKKDFMKAYKQYVPDARVVGELWPKLGTKDWTPYITKIMASDADFVYGPIWGGDIISFTKTAWDFGYFEKVKHAGQDWGNIETLRSFKKRVYPKGVLGGSHYPWWILDTPTSNAFVKKMKKEVGEAVGLAVATGYSTVYIMKNAIEKVGSLDTEKIIKAIEGMEFDSPVGIQQIRACDHQTLWPFWVGPIVVSDKYPWPLITNPVLLDPEKRYRTCEEIEAARKAEQ